MNAVRLQYFRIRDAIEGKSGKKAETSNENGSPGATGKAKPKGGNSRGKKRKLDVQDANDEEGSSSAAKIKQEKLHHDYEDELATSGI